MGLDVSPELRLWLPVFLVGPLFWALLIVLRPMPRLRASMSLDVLEPPRSL